ncbi:MAG: hypothetical protein LBI91_04235, partial [Spirochaetaceae bacterium]|nr:hypothetical protein [Spirochaetaceae bacterium]
MGLMLRKSFPFFLAFFLLVPLFTVPAQEDGGGDGGDDIPIESDWDSGPVTLYTAGDKTFSIAIGALFPVLFLNNDGQPYARSYPIG